MSILSTAKGKRRIRCELFQQANGCCRYCRKEMHWDEFTVDHIIPVARGGTSRVSNLWAACKRCNCLKGKTTPLRFFAHVHQRGAQ